MKKVVKLLAVLFIALSFYGCKNNDDEFNASINEVFYTSVNPDGFTLAELRDFKVTNIRDHYNGCIKQHRKGSWFKV